MKIVVDTNVVFSALLNTDSKVGDLLLNSAGIFEFHTCHLLRAELTTHRERLLRIAGYSEAKLNEIQHHVFQALTFVSEELIPFGFWQNAVPIVRDVDMDDIAFVALTDFLSAKLWTGDRKLLAGIRAKGYPHGLATDELQALREELERQR